MRSRAAILIAGKRTGRISALDRGLAYGDGVFRTMRYQHGGVVHWYRQYAKLAADCARIGIACPAREVWESDIAQLIEERAAGIIKLTVTRGEGGRGYSLPHPCSPVRIAARFPATSVPFENEKRGVAIRWCSKRVGSQPALAGVKHLNRLDNVLARAEWSASEIAEGLMLDHAGRVIEGTMTNLFILEGDHLVTPSLDEAGVAGVQRDIVMELAPSVGMKCVIEGVSQERLLAADQVLLTNSVIGLWWCSSLGDRRWRQHMFTSELVRLLRGTYA